MGTVRTHRLAREYDVGLVQTMFPLHPDVPPSGLPLREYARGRFDLERAHARLKSVMDAEGLPFVPAERIVNSRLAQELGKWGEAKAPGLHDALYRAHFVEGKDLSRPATLVELARAQGLDAAEAERVLADRTMKDAVDRDWRRARQVGVTGVPTYLAASRGVVGAQPYEVLEELARAAGATKKSD